RFQRGRDGIPAAGVKHALDTIPATHSQPPAVRGKCGLVPYEWLQFPTGGQVKEPQRTAFAPTAQSKEPSVGREAAERLREVIGGDLGPDVGDGDPSPLSP